MMNSDSDLMTKISKGDRKTFERIVDKYERTIFNVAFRMANNYEDAMDITQTVFI
ncbi:MAG: RNA polymerase subunit sigma-24, partial [Candidatus Krumholzibacteria bacterium]|nr:RNA polymerase subunit sigma-24 [Candidatus Krumholzibacteria bacterium]